MIYLYEVQENNKLLKNCCLLFDKVLESLKVIADRIHFVLYDKDEIVNNTVVD